MAKSRTPARAALADAISVRDAAAAEKTAADEALRSFDELLTETRSAWSLAIDGLEEAKSNLANSLRMHGGSEEAALRDAAVQGLPAPRVAIANAKVAFEEAEERFKLGKEGREPLKMRVLAAEHDLERADRKVREAVYEVEREPLATLLTEAKKTQAEAFRQRSVIRHVAFSLDGVNGNWNNVTEGLAPDVRKFLHSGVGDNDSSAIAPWQAARKALMHNPDARLPAGES